MWEVRNRPRRVAEDIPLDEELNEAERLHQYVEQMATARAAIGQKLAKLRLAQVRLGLVVRFDKAASLDSYLPGITLLAQSA